MATPKDHHLTDPAHFTDAVIADLKAKHGDVYRIVVEDTTQKYDPYRVPDEDDADLTGKVCYLRRPLDREMNFALSKMPALFDAGKVIVKACWLGGDPDILTDDKLLNAAAMQCVELIEVRKAKLKKL